MKANGKSILNMEMELNIFLTAINMPGNINMVILQFT